MQGSKRKDISVVLPVFNEEENIELLCTTIKQVLDSKVLYKNAR